MLANAISSVLKDLLNVLDIFKVQPQSDEAKSIPTQLTSDSLVKTLEKNGVEVVSPARRWLTPMLTMTMQQDENLPSGSNSSYSAGIYRTVA